MLTLKVLGVDISKAHRGFMHTESRHGYLGCQIDEQEEVLGDPRSHTGYVIKMRTFSISGYW